MSVGVLRDGMPFAGAVYDGVTRWLFTACVGRGAWLNDRPLYAGRGLRTPRALIAGAAPIVMEAGGVLTSAEGAPLFPAWPAPAVSARVAIVAGNPTIHRAFTEALPDRHPPVTRPLDTPAR